MNRIDKFKQLVTMNLDEGFSSEASVDRALSIFGPSERGKVLSAILAMKGMKFERQINNEFVPIGRGNFNYMLPIKRDAVVIQFKVKATNCVFEAAKKRGTDAKGNIYVAIGGEE